MKKILEYIADAYCKTLELLYTILLEPLFSLIVFVFWTNLLKPFFSLIAFIFWKNKYSKQYWERRKSWRKTMHRLRSHAQKDIILTTIIPALEKQGFERPPFSSSLWGWGCSRQGYNYTMFRLEDDELQEVEISTSYARPYFEFYISVYKLIPNISNIAELGKYDSLILFPEVTSFSVRKDFTKYRLKSFSSEKELEKKVRRLKLKFEKWAANIDKEFEDYRKGYTPAIIDINQKLKETPPKRPHVIRMTSKEYLKLVADTRRSVGREYGFRQSSYINFKVEADYFFCVFYFGNSLELTVKPMYADDLWWDIWKAKENKEAALSLRGLGVFSLEGQILLKVEDFPECDDADVLQEAFETFFKGASAEISKFLEANPNADNFYPDESKINDRDRLLYLMTLIHNDRIPEVLSIIKEARRNKHSCKFHSGLYGDDYTFIREWCWNHRLFARAKKYPLLYRLLKLLADDDGMVFTIHF